MIPIPRTEGRKSFLPIYAQPTAGHIAYGYNIQGWSSYQGFILNGSDLSISRLPPRSHELLSSVYTDSTMQGRVFVGHTTKSDKTQISLLKPTKKGGFRTVGTTGEFHGHQRIFGGTTLATCETSKLNFYELNIERLERISDRVQAAKSLSCLDISSTTVIPLSSRTQLTYCRDMSVALPSLNVIDYRDDKPGASALISSAKTEYTRRRYMTACSGFKAASRAFLGDCNHLWTVEHGAMRLTSIDLFANDGPGRDVFTFSDTLPTIGISRMREVALFDVKREKQIFSREIKFAITVKSLFVDGMPQLLHISTFCPQTPMAIMV